MKLGALVRNNKNASSFFDKGQIHQAIEIKEKSDNYGVKVKIIDLKKILYFDKIKKEIDIVYDKCYTQSKEERILLRDFHQKCKKSGIPIFNDYEFLKIVGNKWKMHNFLKHQKEIKNYLVPTLFYSQENFQKLLKLYSVLILKPVCGQEGVGVIETKKQQKYFLAKHKIKDGEIFKIISHNLKDFSEIESLISKIWRNNIYIIQPKIESVEFKGRIFDIRLALQKNKTWEISGIGARAAARGSFLCNIKAGGEMFDAREVIGKVFPKKAKKIISELETASIKIGQFLESRIEGLVAEMGFDFMLDKKGKIWLLEINSKPSPEIFYKKKMEKIREKMTLWPLVFTKYYYENRKQYRS